MRKILSLLVLMFALSGIAQARPANDVTTSYFSDRTKTKLVGTMELTCAGGRISFGRKTAFFTQTTDSCALHRISRSSVLSAARPKISREQICYNMCAKRFGGLEVCLPDGTCPQHDALDECNASCATEFRGQ